MKLIAVDPGTTESAWVEWFDDKILGAEIWPNDLLIERLATGDPSECLAIEMVACYGMPVGKEVFETCLWIGEFKRQWKISTGQDARLIYRRDVKMHHCGNARAKDSNIRQALVDKYGAPGTKANKGLTYGLKSHLWAAFAIATYVTETILKCKGLWREAIVEKGTE
jgi:hypothetical protein